MVLHRMEPRRLRRIEVELCHNRVIESIGSDQVVDVRNELVHRRAPEVVLSQLRGLH